MYFRLRMTTWFSLLEAIFRALPHLCANGDTLDYLLVQLVPPRSTTRDFLFCCSSQQIRRDKALLLTVVRTYSI